MIADVMLQAAVNMTKILAIHAVVLHSFHTSENEDYTVVDVHCHLDHDPCHEVDLHVHDLQGNQEVDPENGNANYEQNWKTTVTQ